MDYGGHTSRSGSAYPNGFEIREYLLTEALKRTETDGRCDITFLLDGPVLGLFSQKCQDSTFSNGQPKKSAVFSYLTVV